MVLSIGSLNPAKYLTPASSGARKISIALPIQSLDPRLQDSVAHAGQDEPPKRCLDGLKNIRFRLRNNYADKVSGWANDGAGECRFCGLHQAWWFSVHRSPKPSSLTSICRLTPFSFLTWVWMRRVRLSTSCAVAAPVLMMKLP